MAGGHYIGQHSSRQRSQGQKTERKEPTRRAAMKIQTLTLTPVQCTRELGNANKYHQGNNSYVSIMFLLCAIVLHVLCHFIRTETQEVSTAIISIL